MEPTFIHHMMRSTAVDRILAVVILDPRTWMPEVSLRLLGKHPDRKTCVVHASLYVPPCFGLFRCAMSIRFPCDILQRWSTKLPFNVGTGLKNAKSGYGSRSSE